MLLEKTFPIIDAWAHPLRREAFRQNAGGGEAVSAIGFGALVNE